MKRSIFYAGILTFGTLFAPCATFADTPPPLVASPIVAQIGTVTITRDQLDNDATLQFVKYMSETDVYNKQRAWIERKTRDIRYELAAKEAKLTVAAWHKKEIDDTVIPPTPQEIDNQAQMFSQQAAQRGQLVSDPKFQEQIKKQASEGLLQQRKAMREQQVAAALAQKYAVSMFLTPPESKNAPYNADDPVKGPANARVTIVEYTDFQCPYCKRSQEPLHQVLAAYPNDVKLVAKAFPLPMHTRARPTVEAAFCAKEQNKYWEFRDMAFAISPQLEDPDLMKIAKDLGLNMKKFETCYHNHAFAGRVDADVAGGQDLGVQGTPHFFVNGQVVNGAMPFESFKAVIDKELAKKS